MTRSSWAFVVACLAACHAHAVSGPTLAPPLTPPHVRSLSTGTTCEEFPSFTADGNNVVFDSYLDGGRGLYKLDLTTGQRERLTQQNAEVWDYWDQWDHIPKVSPNGRLIAYIHELRDGTELRVMPIDGDHDQEPRTLARVDGSQVPAWRDDNTVLAIDEKNNLIAVDLTGHSTLVGKVADDQGITAIIPLRDKRTLLTTSTFTPTARPLLIFGEPGAPATEVPVPLFTPQSAVRFRDGALSLDGKQFYQPQGFTMPQSHLVVRPISGEAGEKVPGVSHPTSGFSLSSDHKRLVYSTCFRYITVARVAPDGKVSDLTPRSQDAIILRPAFINPHTLIFSSLQALARQVQTFDLETKQSHLVNDGASLGHLGFDGKSALIIHWATPTDPRHGIYVQTLDGGPERAVTEGKFDIQPKPSHDGKYIYYIQAQSMSQAGPIRRVPFTGGEPETVVEGEIDHFAISPVDDHIVFFNDTEMVLKEQTAGKPRRFFGEEKPIYFADFNFSADGKKLLLLREGIELEEVDLTNPAHRPKVLTHLERRTAISADYAPDGSVLAVMQIWDGGMYVAEGQFP